MSTDLTPAQLQAAAVAAANKALRHIENAQNEIGDACSELSKLNGGIPVWTASHRMYDKVRALWYRVESFRNGGEFSLDDTNVEALKARARQVAAESAERGVA